MQTFDADGNNTSDTVTLGNEVTYDGTYHYQYDKEGNETLMYDTTTSTTWSYSYDDENQMTEAQETIGYTLVMEANYEYDAFGSQVEENVGTTATEYVQDHWNPATAGATGLSGTNVVADVTAAGSLITGYVWGNEVDQLFGRYDTSLSSVPTAGAYYLFVDQNGSVRDVVNSSGVDKDSIKYDGFGAFVTQTNANYLGLYGYDSYHYDAATGNYDDNARDYDPVSQRWVTMDPDGIGGGTPNLYEYAGNDPTNATDPSGLEKLTGEFDGGKTTFEGTTFLNQRVFAVGVDTWQFENGKDLVFSNDAAKVAIKRAKDLKLDPTPHYQVLFGRTVVIQAEIAKGTDAANYYWSQTIDYKVTSKKEYNKDLLPNIPAPGAVLDGGEKYPFPAEPVKGATVCLEDGPGIPLWARK